MEKKLKIQIKISETTGRTEIKRSLYLTWKLKIKKFYFVVDITTCVISKSNN